MAPGLGVQTRSATSAIAVVVVAVLVAVIASACAAMTTPSTPAPDGSMVRIGPAPTTVSPAEAPSPNERPSLPPGVTVIDTAHGIDRVAWSPDAQSLAVETASGTVGLGVADILSADGRYLGAVSGSDYAWLDASHLVTLDGAGSSQAILRSVDGTERTTAPGLYSGILGNEHGLVALIGEASAPNWPEAFWIWSASGIGPEIRGRGFPVAWSPDGHLLALFTPRPKATGDTGSIQFASAGGGDTPATLSVLRFPGVTPVAGGTGELPGMRTVVAFSADDRWLALSQGRGTAIFDLHGGPPTTISGVAPLGWSPDGRLVLQEPDGTVRLRAPSGSLGDPGLPPGFVHYGPSMDDVAIFQQDATDKNSGRVLIRIGDFSVTIPLRMAGPGATVLWSADGSACYVATGTDDVQQLDDRLLRVARP